MLDSDIQLAVTTALYEDLGVSLNPHQDSQQDPQDVRGQDLLAADITAQLIPANKTATAQLITREAGIFCGKAWAQEVFRQLGSEVSINWQVADGDAVTPNQVLCTLKGSARAILTGERTAMNFIQTLSGVASLTQQYVAKLAGT
ncbi:MAG: nicotinate-nucleotide diphosphorylase, partial [Shewanella sp.]|nr:nicotinate-nucleotide diphosphorylase [Shewanella sp.]